MANQANEELRFDVEEFHRGEWQPLMIKKGKKSVQKHVMITEEQSEIMNSSGIQRKERYVLAEAKFDVETAKRPALLAFCKDNELAFKPNDKNVDLVAKIKEFLGQE